MLGRGTLAEYAQPMRPILRPLLVAVLLCASGSAQADDPTRTLDRFADELELLLPIGTHCEAVVTQDGEAAGGERLLFDAEGRLIEASGWYPGPRITGAPPRVERHRRWVRDAEGRPIEIHRTDSNDPPEVERRQYDEHGRLVLVVVDVDGDGQPDQRHTITYDGDGRVLTLNYESMFDRLREIEWGPFGPLTITDTSSSSTAVTRFEYSPDGLVVSEREETQATGDEMRLVREQRHHYDGGRLIRVDITSHRGPSPIEYAKTFEYDEAGNVQREAELDETGELSRYLLWVYDEAGNLTRKTELGDQGADMQIEVTTYDERGRPARWECDGCRERETANGIPERAIEFRYDCE